MLIYVRVMQRRRLVGRNALPLSPCPRPQHERPAVRPLIRATVNKLDQTPPATQAKHVPPLIGRNVVLPNIGRHAPHRRPA
jgi:hypothetical protein